MPNQVLQSISIIDTPGILSGEKQRISRGQCLQYLLYSSKMFILVFIVSQSQSILYCVINKGRELCTDLVTWPHTQCNRITNDKLYTIKCTPFLLLTVFSSAPPKMFIREQPFVQVNLGRGKIMSRDQHSMHCAVQLAGFFILKSVCLSLFLTENRCITTDRLVHSLED